MNVIDPLLKSLGLNPEDIRTGIENAGKEYAAFKAGWSAALRHFDSRLTDIETGQREILAAMQRLNPEAYPPRANGKDTSHEHVPQIERSETDAG